MDLGVSIIFILQSVLMQTQTGGNDIWYIYILPFVVPAITALVMFLRKEGKSDATLGMTQYEVESLKDDFKDIKDELKEVERKSSDALRQIDIINIKLENIEREHRMRDNKGAV